MLLPLLVLPIGLAPARQPPAEQSRWLAAAGAADLDRPAVLRAVDERARSCRNGISATDDRRRRSDPYFLYAASNLGSFLALVAYPLIVEPTLRLQQQTQSVGDRLRRARPSRPASSARSRHGVAAATDARRRRGQAARRTPRRRSTWARRARWIALAFVPSSLLLAVTSYISTDVASVPLLLDGAARRCISLTFVVAFSPSAGPRRERWPTLHAARGHRAGAGR